MPQNAEKEYEKLVKLMESTGEAKASKMFGMPCLKTNSGKAFAGYFKGDTNFKLPQNIIQPWLRNPGAKLFDPGMGRPMKEWLQLSVEHSDHWPELAEEALKFVNQKSKK